MLTYIKKTYNWTSYQVCPACECFSGYSRKKYDAAEKHTKEIYEKTWTWPKE